MERREMASFPNREENQDWVKRHAGSMARKGAQAVALESLQSYGSLKFSKAALAGMANVVVLSQRSIVNIPAVADFHDQDDKFVIMDQTHQPVVTHAISPCSFDRKVG